MDQLIPRGAIFKDETDLVPDYTDGYKMRITEYREAIRSEAFRSLQNSPEYKNIGKYEAYLRGEQWDSRRSSYRSKFFNNKMDKSRYDNLALLTDARPTIDVSSTVPDWQPSADIAGDVIRCEWTRARMDLSLVKILDISQLWGTSFAKINAGSPGMMSLLPLGPDQVFPIQPGWNLQSSTALLYRTWKNLDYFKNKYPISSAGIERWISSPMLDSNAGFSRPGYIQQYTWDAMAPQMKAVLGVSSATSMPDSRGLFGGIELNEIYLDDYSTNDSNRSVIVKDPYLALNAHNWWYKVEPGQRLYPRKRLLVFGGAKLVYDGPSPYWHGLYPFACLRLRETPRSFYGLSEYRNQIPLQDAINEIGAGHGKAYPPPNRHYSRRCNSRCRVERVSKR